MKRNESFAGRFLLLCSSNVLLQIMGFLYRILLSRYAGPEGLGVYRLSSSIYSILHATCLSGITLAGTRFSSTWKVEHKEGAVRILVRSIFLIFVLLFGAAAFCVWFSRAYIGEVLIGDRRAVSAIPIILICLFLYSYRLTAYSYEIKRTFKNGRASIRLEYLIPLLGSTLLCGILIFLIHALYGWIIFNISK